MAKRSKRERRDDERLLERLQETASGESAVRQLRQRYDALRGDYEALLDRLAELEERLEASDRPHPAPAAPVPASGTLTEALLAPLVQLRAEYLSAATSIETIVGGLDSLAAGAMKGQRTTAPEERPAPVRVHDEPAPPHRPRQITVDVKAEGFGALLDFQERLAGLEGVDRVSINAIDGDRATLVVELTEDPEHDDDR